LKNYLKHFISTHLGFVQLLCFITKLIDTSENYTVTSLISHCNVKNSFRQLRHAGDALLRAPPAFVRSLRACDLRCWHVRSRVHAWNAISCSAGLATTRVTLVTMVLIYLIWLTTNLSRDSFAAMDSRAITPVVFHTCILCYVGTNANGFFQQINGWLFCFVRTRGNIPLTGLALALTAQMTSLISGQNVITAITSASSFPYLVILWKFESYSFKHLNELLSL